MEARNKEREVPQLRDFGQVSSLPGTKNGTDHKNIPLDYICNANFAQFADLILRRRAYKVIILSDWKQLKF